VFFCKYQRITDAIVPKVISLRVTNDFLTYGLSQLGGHDACTGDSGGPYVCRNKDGRYAIQGIVSFGEAIL